METRPPTFTRIMIAVAFAISCFALALFLWLTFGGPIPLKPEGYRLTVPFNEATQLAQESDVRVSGVSVGTVKRVDLNDEGRAEAEIEIDPEFAPIPSDTRAILRQKTLLGETYVELTPGSDEADPLPENGDLPPAQVSDAVQLDEIFRTFDDSTRAAFQAWMQGQAASLRGRGDDLSVAIASLDPFAREADRALRLLDSEETAVSGFVRNAGQVFEALSERPGQLRGLVENAATVFETTARRDRDLATAFTIFPTFLRETRETLSRLERFATDTDPVVVALQPTARELTPTAQSLARVSPVLDSFFTGLKRTIDVAPKGSEALRRLLGDDLPPILERFDPWLAELNPILKGVSHYRHEITAALANVAAATNGIVTPPDPKTGELTHFLRTEAPLTPESVTTFPHRLQINRTNPYVKPGGYLDVRTALKSFETRQCSAGAQVTLPDEATTVAAPAFNIRTGGDLEEATSFYQRLKEFTFNGQDSTAGIAAPPCIQQAPYESIGSPHQTSAYQHYFPLP